PEAAVEGATSRLRPILMTSLAMVAGMMPMAAGFGEAASQTAPLGRAVVGGLIGSTCATLLVLPAIFAILQGSKVRKSASLDPDDPMSPRFRRLNQPSSSNDNGQSPHLAKEDAVADDQRSPGEHP